jgi:hypothetical protein
MALIVAQSRTIGKLALAAATLPLDPALIFRNPEVSV